MLSENECKTNLDCAKFVKGKNISCTIGLKFTKSRLKNGASFWAL